MPKNSDELNHHFYLMPDTKLKTSPEDLSKINPIPVWTHSNLPKGVTLVESFDAITDDQRTLDGAKKELDMPLVYGRSGIGNLLIIANAFNGSANAIIGATIHPKTPESATGSSGTPVILEGPGFDPTSNN